VIRLLVVDDSALMRRLLGEVFKSQGDFEVEFARDGLEALEKLHVFCPDVVTLDIHMPNMDGLACLDRIMVERPARVIMLSSLTAAGASVTLDAMQKGAIDFIAKPSGAVSLAIDELGPRIVEKVRAAASAKLRPALRLAERIRHKTQAAIKPEADPRTRPAPAALRIKARGPADKVVVVGTSTGGPPALDALLSPLPAEFPWPVIVAQHMPAAFTGTLARRIDRLCSLNVVEVTHPMPIERGNVYIGKGEADIIVTKRSGVFVATSIPASAEYRWHPSVDRLVTSAMEQFGAARVVGVLMTGMGNDGAAAMSRLFREGGHTIAEAEETAVVWGMPGELVQAGGAEIVAPLDAIAGHLVSLAA
jgi:two-component system, chemotaxis family, protein-glutamate methylesterase/glutaminase